jgi:hypothetical protein
VVNTAMRKLVAMLPALVIAGCDLEAEAEADRVCVTQDFPDQRIPGASGLPGGAGGAVTLPITFALDIGPAVPDDLGEEGVDADVNASSIALASQGGSADFSGVTLLTFDVVAPGQPDVEFRYERPASAAPGPLRSLEARPTVPIDLVDYLQGEDTIQVRGVTLAGRPPEQSWIPALVTCGTAKVTVDYLEAGGL